MPRRSRGTGFSSCRCGPSSPTRTGNYTAYGKDRVGVTQRLRGVDGIHFTAAGYELIAEKIVGQLAAPTPPAKAEATEPAGTSVAARIEQ